MNAPDGSSIATATLPSRAELRDQIERLAIPADAKAVLDGLAGVTVRVGSTLIHAGRHILVFILEAVRMFPHTTFGLIAASVISMLIAAVPFLGVVLAPMLTPLLLAFGLAAGALADLRDGALRGRIRRLEDDFLSLARAA